MNAFLGAIPSLFVPFFLRPGFTYDRATFQSDVMAGLTVALIQIPQTMAFALIAGLPAVYGLYASLPGFIASIFGSSKQLSTGPVAVVSLLTFTSLVPFAEPGSPEFIGLASLLAVLVGLIYLLMGVFRLGFILHLVPQSVVLGFSSAAAAIIVATQLPVALGVTPAQHDLVLQNIWSLILEIPNLSVVTVGVALSALMLLMLSRRLPKVFPSALLLLIFGILGSYLLDLSSFGVALVAQVPSSLPTFTLPSLSAVPFLSLIPKAAIIALVGFVATHATAKSIAGKNKLALDTDQELVGQGLANIVTGFFKGFPLAGSITRTALNVEAGAKTPVSAITSTVVTIIALLFLAPLFAYLPRAVLAMIVIFAAIPLVNVSGLRETYRISSTDGYVAFLTFAMAFILKPDDAIFIGIVAALMLFIRQTISGARVHEMGIDRQWNILRGAIDEDRVDTHKGVCIGRVAMSMYYANSMHILQEIDVLLKRSAQREKAPVRELVLDMSGVHFIDITAMEILAEYIERLGDKGTRVSFIYLRKAVRDSLEKLPDLVEVTILHNIVELKQFCMPENSRTLNLGGTQPEKIGYPIAKTA